MTNFTIEQLEALKEGATPGPWGTMTTGVAGGDHWYVCDLSESLALIATNDGEDEEVRGPNARLMAAAPGLVDALIAEKQAHAKLRAEMQEMRDWYIARSQRMQSIYAETFDSRFADRAEYDENVADQLTEILEENK